MYIATNKFGEKTIYDETDLEGKKVYFFNCACLTIHAESLEWANRHVDQVVKNVKDADVVIILGCQVTDLSVLNDIMTMIAYMAKYENKEYYMGGCLAQRFDIDVEKIGCKRMDILRVGAEYIKDPFLVKWQSPYWNPTVKDFLRYNYPLRVSAGCHGKCEYCTIKITRGKAFDIPIENHLTTLKKFVNKDYVITAVADTMAVDKIKELYEVATRYNVKFALRNIEPTNLIKAKDILLDFADSKFLDTVHCPVQSDNIDILKLMNRDVKDTLLAITLLEDLKKKNVKIGTNIIIDYMNKSGNIIEANYDKFYRIFDHVSWNPYWNGKWNIYDAMRRMAKYNPTFRVTI